MKTFDPKDYTPSVRLEDVYTKSMHKRMAKKSNLNPNKVSRREYAASLLLEVMSQEYDGEPSIENRNAIMFYAAAMMISSPALKHLYLTKSDVEALNEITLTRSEKEQFKTLLVGPLMVHFPKESGFNTFTIAQVSGSWREGIKLQKHSKFLQKQENHFRYKPEDYSLDDSLDMHIFGHNWQPLEKPGHIYHSVVNEGSINDILYRALAGDHVDKSYEMAIKINALLQREGVNLQPAREDEEEKPFEYKLKKQMPEVHFRLNLNEEARFQKSKKRLHSVRKHIRQYWDEKFYHGEFEKLERGTRISIINAHTRGEAKDYFVGHEDKAVDESYAAVQYKIKDIAGDARVIVIEVKKNEAIGLVDIEASYLDNKGDVIDDMVEKGISLNNFYDFDLVELLLRNDAVGVDRVDPFVDKIFEDIESVIKEVRKLKVKRSYSIDQESQRTMA